ncbi:MAG: LEPR-XLL domain-containing protein, partial [Phycisphaerales bacterium]|nr:LEPR-XLL domain-containing protein [Phycisphaerales bacterium]
MRKSKPRVRDGGFRFEPLEPRVLLSGTPIPVERPDHFRASAAGMVIDGGDATAFGNGMLAIRSVLESVGVQDAYMAPLPLVGGSMLERLPAFNVFQEDVINEIATFFAENKDPDVAAFESFFEGMGWTVNFNGSNNELSATVPVRIDESLTNQSVDLATREPIELGGGDLALGLDLPNMNISTDLVLDVTFGVDLDTSAFFAQIPNFTVAIDASAPTLNAQATLGFLGMSVVNGSIDFHAGLDIDIANGQRQTLSQLQNTPIATLADLNVDPTSGIAAEFPLQLTGGIGNLFSVSGSPRVDLTVSDLFGVGTGPSFDYDVTNLDQFLSFDVATPAAVISAFNQLANWFDNFGSSEVFGLDLPFLSGVDLSALNLGGVITEAFTEELQSIRLTANNNAPTGSVITTLTVRINDEQNVAIALSGNFANADALVAAINAQITTKLNQLFAQDSDNDFRGMLEAHNADGRIEFIGNPSKVSNMRITHTGAGVGFQQNQQASGLPFNSIQSLATLLSNALEPTPAGAITPNYNPATHELTFEVSFAETLLAAQKPLNFNYEFPVEALGGFSTSSNMSIMSTVSGGFTFGFLLEELAPSFVLTNATTLNSLMANAGFEDMSFTDSAFLKSSGHELVITLRNGVKHNINLEGVTTIGQVITRINQAVPNMARINSDMNGLDLVHPAGITGNSNFTVRAANSSFAIYVLGLLAGGEQVGGEFLIKGTALHGESLADRMFFRDDAFLEGRIDAVAADIDATARFGFVDLGVVNGGASGFVEINVGLDDPNDSGELFLSELIDAVKDGNVDGIVDGNGLPTPTGHFMVNLPIEAEILNLEPSVMPGMGPRIMMVWDAAAPDVFDPMLMNLEDLASFEHLGIADIIHAFTGDGGLLDFFRDIEAFDEFFQLELPLLNTSISDLINFVDMFAEDIERFEDNPASSLQTLASSLAQTLGIPANLVEVAFDAVGATPAAAVPGAAGGGPVLNFGFMWMRSFQEQMPLNLDLGELVGLDELGNLVDVGGDALMQVNGGAALALDFGIDLSDPLSPTPFIRDSTGIVLTLGAGATDMDMSAALGPLGIFIQNGLVALGRRNNINQPARFTIGLDDSDSDGRIDIADLDFSDATIDLDAQIMANLPMFFPTATNSIGALNLTIGDLTDIAGTTTTQVPDFSSALDSLSLRDNLAALVDGWIGLMGFLEDALDGEFEGIELPIIGDNLQSASDFFGVMRDAVIGVLDPDDLMLTEAEAASRAAGESFGFDPVDAMRQALFDGLGDTGWLLNAPGTGAGVNIEDIVVIDDGDSIEFRMRIGQPDMELIPSDSGFDFDVGLPGLGLAAEGEVSFKSSFELDLGIGVNLDEGVFFNFDPFGEGDDITLDLEASVPGFNATGSLLFLQLDINDEDAFGDDGDQYDASSLGLSFGIDLDGAAGSGRFPLTEVFSGLADFEAFANLNVDLNLEGTASFAGLAQFPSLDFFFDLDWAASASTATGLDFDEVPTIWFRDVRVDFGTLVGDVLGPVVDSVGDIIGPAADVVEILTTPIPLISDLAGPTTLIDIAEIFASEFENVGEFIEAVVDVVELIDFLDNFDSMGGSVFLDVGSFQVSGADAMDENMMGGLSPIDQIVMDPLGQVDPMSQAGMAFNMARNVGAMGIDPTTPTPAGANVGFSFPMFEHPEMMFQLLLGGNPSMIEYDFPKFGLGFQYSQYFPIIGPLGAQVTGSVGAFFDFGFGFDTYGIRQFAESDFNNFGAIFEGFFIKDLNDAGEDVPEVQLVVEIAAGVEVNVAVGRAGVEGGIRGTIDFNLHDLDDDGKFRLNELIENFNLGDAGIHIFDISAKIDAFLRAYLEILLIFNFDVTIIDVTVFEFTLPRPDTTPVLAEKDGMGTLNINVGSRAGMREHGDTADGAESFILKPGDNAGDVTVEAYGLRQTYSGVQRVMIADAGAGNDSIVVAGGLEIPVEVHGGAGNDTLTASKGAVVFYGDAGNDKLTGGRANDMLFGGEGADIINAGTGDDHVEGGEGNDMIFGDPGVDMLLGGAGDDQMFGGRGNDVMDGGAGVDHMLGDENDDLMSGGEGNDTVEGGLGMDALIGDIGTAALNAEGDWVINEGSLSGSGNDVLLGNEGFDVMHGVGGNDDLVGADGGDTMFGGDGSDLLRGETGNDFLDGGLGNDDGMAFGQQAGLIGGLGSDEIVGGWGKDRIFAGNAQIGATIGENHTIYGDVQDPNAAAPGSPNDHGDFIYGDLGIDTVDAGPGNDVVRTYLGSATVHGRQGMDDILIAGTGADVIFVDAGTENDTVNITGGVGNVDVFGREGNETVNINADGRIRVDAGSGNDHVTIVGEGDGEIGVIGGSGIDDIDLGSAGNILAGGGAIDVFGDAEGVDDANGANDDIRIFATGPVMVDAGEGGDKVDIRGPADDVLVLGDGAAGLIGAPAPAAGPGSAGADDIDIVADGDVTVDAGPANDTVTILGAVSGDVEIIGGGGADDIDLGSMFSPTSATQVDVFGDAMSGALATGGVDHIDLYAPGVIHVNAAELGDFVTIRGGAGAINVLADGTAGAIALGMQGADVVNIVGNTMITVQAGGHDDDVTVNGAGLGPVKVVGDHGSDDIVIGKPSGVLASGAITVFGDGEFGPLAGGMRDDVEIHANGPITVDLAEGDDDLIVRNFGSGAVTVYGDDSAVVPTAPAAGTEGVSGPLAGPDDIDIVAGTGAITVYGQAGDDDILIAATGGNSLVYSHEGADIVRITGPGNDAVLSGTGDDDVYGGGGLDMVVAGFGDDLVWGDDEGQDDAGAPLPATAIGDVIWGGDLPDEWLALADFGRQFFSDAGDFIEPPGFEVAEQFNPTTYRERYGFLNTVPLGGMGVSIAGVSRIGDRFDANNNPTGDGEDEIHGGHGGDFIFSGWGEDNLYGGAGRDYVDGGEADDRVRGGDDDDVLLGGLNSDILRGGEGIDQLYGNEGDDFEFADHGQLGGAFPNDQAGQRLWGGAGFDYLYAYSPSFETETEFDKIGDELRGGTGGDYLYGNTRMDLLLGGDDNDYLHGDYLEGPTYPRNTLAAENRETDDGDFVGSADTLYGGFGQDQLYGGAGNDTMFGGRDPDWVEGQDGNDRAFGGNGVDILVLDVDGNYHVLGDDFDGFFGNEAEADVADAREVDILLVEGDKTRAQINPFNDNIILTETDVAITGDRNLPANGRLGVGTTATFMVTLTGSGVPMESFAVSVPNDPANLNIDNLITDVNTALTAALNGAGLPSTSVRAVRAGDRIRLQTVGLGQFSELLVTNANTTTANVLGIAADAFIDAFVTGGAALPADGSMGGAAQFRVTINGTGVNQQAINVTVADESLTLDGLVAAVDLAINAALQAASLPSDAVRALRVGDFLRLETNGLGAPGTITLSNLNATAMNLFGLTTGQSGGPLTAIAGRQLINVDYSGRSIYVGWRNRAGLPLVEQFQISGLMGRDVIEAHLSDATIEQLANETPGDPWVTVISGGPGEDIVRGSQGRDRINGGPGSDQLYGFGGNDRIWGAEFGGDPVLDIDQLFAGQGNDDLIGGNNQTQFYAWSVHPEVSANQVSSFDVEDFLADGPGDDFGVYVDDAGNLTLDDGGGAFEFEDTGLNRFLGSDNETTTDYFFGGTGLDFMFGNGGGGATGDRLVTRRGVEFQDEEGLLFADDAWKEYARSTDQVWYLGASAADDTIEVDFVTNPYNPFFGRHVVTLSTDGAFDPRFSGFDNATAYDGSGDPTHEMMDEVYEAETELMVAAVEVTENLGEPDIAAVPMDTHDRLDDPFSLTPFDLINELLGEEDFLAIIIDALGGDDHVVVGETVQTSVWVDAGPGNDLVEIEPQLSFLPDVTDPVGNRNDAREDAYPLGDTAAPGTVGTGSDTHGAGGAILEPIGLDNSVFTGLTIDSARSDNPDIDWYRFLIAPETPTTPGDELQLIPLHDNDDIDLVFSLFDAAGNPEGETAVIGTVLLPLNGRLTANAQFTLNTDVVLVTAAATAENETRGDLIDDINAAIVSPNFNASLDDGRLRIETVGFGPGASLNIAGATLATTDQLGLRNSHAAVVVPLLSGLETSLDEETTVRVESVGNIPTDYAVVFAMAALEDGPDTLLTPTGQPLGDTRQTAFVLDTDRPINRIDDVVGLTLHESSDEDWYAFTLGETSGTNPIRLTSHTPTTAMRIELYHANDVAPIAAATTSADDAHVQVELGPTAEPQFAGDEIYYIRVVRQAVVNHPGERGRYDLFLNVGTAVQADTVVDDPFVLPSLDQVLPVLDESLNLPGEEAWYQLTLSEPARPGEGIAIRSVGAFSDLDANIYQILDPGFLAGSGAVTIDDLINQGDVTPALATVHTGELVDFGAATVVVDRGVQVIDLANLGPDVPDTAVSYLIGVTVAERDLDDNGVPDPTAIGYELFSISTGVEKTRLNLVAGASEDLSGRTPLDRRDVIVGGTGNDRMVGGTGEDWVLGGAGNDVLSGGVDRQASDLLWGGPGDDIFQVIPDAQPIVPSTGRNGDPRFLDDVLTGDAALADMFDGGAGDDQVLFLGGNEGADGVPIRDFVAIGYDRFLHRYRLTALLWDQGNHVFVADPATGRFAQEYAYFQSRDIERTVIDTGDGVDVVHADGGYIFNGETWGVARGDVQDNGLAYQSIEIRGGEGKDWLYGGAGVDIIYGEGNKDFIAGGEGDDHILGGAGNDELSGNEGLFAVPNPNQLPGDPDDDYLYVGFSELPPNTPDDVTQPGGGALVGDPLVQDVYPFDSNIAFPLSADRPRPTGIDLPGRTISDNSGGAERGYTETSPNWAVGPAASFGGSSRQHLRAAQSNAAAAEWVFEGLPAGEYEVFASWPGDPVTPNVSRATNTPYEVFVDGEAASELTIRVNQRIAPPDVLDSQGWRWQRLGVVVVEDGIIRVRLNNDANGTVLADAIHIVPVNSFLRDAFAMEGLDGAEG